MGRLSPFHSATRKGRHAPEATFIALFLVLTALFLPVSPADAVGNPLLERQSVSHRDLGAFDKWTGVLARYEWQRATAHSGCTDNSTCSSSQWEGLISALKDAPFAVKLDEVNRFFNRIAYVTDEENYGTDYWQTPYEFMARGGDCEDYAIAKYLTLKRLGIPGSAMRLLVVNAEGGETHAVLEVRAGEMPYLLDNKTDDVVAESTVHRYAPVYAINEARWWAYK